MIWVGLAHNYRGNVPFYFISAKFCGACPVQGAYFRIILLTSHMARYRRTRAKPFPSSPVHPVNHMHALIIELLLCKCASKAFEFKFFDNVVRLH